MHFRAWAPRSTELNGTVCQVVEILRLFDPTLTNDADDCEHEIDIAFRQRIEESLPILVEALNEQHQSIEDYQKTLAATHSLPNSVDMDKILRYERHQYTKLDWLLGELR